MKIEEKILGLVEKSDKPLKIEYIEKILKLNSYEVKKYTKLLENKKLIVIKDGLCSIATSSKKSLTHNKKKDTPSPSSKNDIGTIDAASDGYAFFIPSNGGGDLFIPKSKLNSAMHGDEVLIKRVRYRGKMEANVIKILKRKMSRVVGRVEVRRRCYMVYPLYRRVSNVIYVRKDKELYNTDDIVLCDITSYSKDNTDIKGKIVSKLGNINDKGIENLIVLNKFNLNTDFPDDVIKYVSENIEKDLSVKIKGRKDYRDLFTVTIDGESARDFDDAISIERKKDGYVLYVHIADVSHYVRLNSILDKEAFARGTSTYFPEFAIPMLPSRLSDDLCSLRPNEEKYALTVKIHYNNLGLRIKSEFYESVIISNNRLTYKAVNASIEGKYDFNSSEVSSFIENSVDLMRKISKRRLENGMIDFDMPEVEFIFDDNGDITDIIPENRGISERVIENFMIESNEVVAEFIESKLKEAVYRNNAAPDIHKVLSWIKTAKLFGLDIEMDDDIEHGSMQEWFNILQDKPYSYFLKSLLVRSMQRAEYAPVNKGHFGLASSCYTHFTSPIRRYPDLIVHRILKHLLFNKEAEISKNYLEKATTSCSSLERNSEDAEREVVLYKKLSYLRKTAGLPYRAYINRIASDGFYVFLENLMMVGFIPISTLQGNRYISNPDKGIIYSDKTGVTYKLGDFLDVVWLSTNIDTLEATFMIYKKGVKGDIKKRYLSGVRNEYKKSTKSKKLGKRKRGK